MVVNGMNWVQRAKWVLENHLHLARVFQLAVLLNVFTQLLAFERYLTIGFVVDARQNACASAFA